MRPFLSLKLRLVAGALLLLLLTFVLFGDELAAFLGIPERSVRALAIAVLFPTISVLMVAASKELEAWRQRNENSGKPDVDTEA